MEVAAVPTVHRQLSARSRQLVEAVESQRARDADQPAKRHDPHAHTSPYQQKLAAPESVRVAHMQLKLRAMRTRVRELEAQNAALSETQRTHAAVLAENEHLHRALDEARRANRSLQQRPPSRAASPDGRMHLEEDDDLAPFASLLLRTSERGGSSHGLGQAPPATTPALGMIDPQYKLVADPQFFVHASRRLELPGKPRRPELTRSCARALGFACRSLVTPTSFSAG